MKLSSEAENTLAQINTETKLGELRKIAGKIKKDHELALELWSTGQFIPRQLAILIMDKKQPIFTTKASFLVLSSSFTLGWTNTTAKQ